MTNLISVKALATTQSCETPPVILDCSWYLPEAQRKVRQEYQEKHIPGARFFDIDEICDLASDLPHMLPAAEQFSHHLGRLGIKEGDEIIVYDSMGVFSSARVWWMFRAYGHLSVRVLNGGFPAWQKAGLAVSSTIVESHCSTYKRSKFGCGGVG